MSNPVLSPGSGGCESKVQTQAVRSLERAHSWLLAGLGYVPTGWEGVGGARELSGVPFLRALIPAGAGSTLMTCPPPRSPTSAVITVGPGSQPWDLGHTGIQGTPEGLSTCSWGAAATDRGLVKMHRETSVWINTRNGPETPWWGTKRICGEPC